MDLAMHAAEAFTTPVVLGRTAKEMYENVCKASVLAQKDFSVVYKVLEGAAEAQAAKNAAANGNSTS
jgi:3-hydroxyisobutyrate dehydrogenase-like beta-hydroxyacid dehydrogenase